MNIIVPMYSFVKTWRGILDSLAMAVSNFGVLAVVLLYYGICFDTLSFPVIYNYFR